jgi:3-hydroxyisobutyrate dehydrogenase-like beta-hydroxyacid dehydrogenase
VYARVKPLLDTFGGTVLHVGERPGQGQVAKLLNNLLSATALAVSAEALTFGVRAGLDPTTLLAVFNAGSGRNTATTDKLPKHVLTRGFGSGFRLELMAKDLDLCLAEARAERFPMVLGSAVQQLWSLARATAAPGADHTEVVRLFEGWAGVELRAGEVSADA